MDQTSQEFLLELEELVEQIFTGLDELRTVTSDRIVQRRVVDRIFRRVHSLKGLAATTGLDRVSRIAHEFEDLLDALRSSRKRLDDDVLDLCERAAEALSEGLDLVSAETAEPDPEDLFGALRATARTEDGIAASDADAILDQVPAELRQSLNDSEQQRLAALLSEGHALFAITTSFDFATFDKDFPAIKEKLNAAGEVVSTSPSTAESQPNSIGFAIVYAAAPCTSVESLVLDFPNTRCEELLAKVERLSQPRESVQNFVRTDLEKLDHLISSTHELFLTTTNAFDLAVSNTEPATEIHRQLCALNEQIRGAFLSVEEELINLRMVPLGPTLQRAVRAGRTAARNARKQIDFEVKGAGLPIDKVVAESIANSLIHLVRNAVAHGIESPDERAEMGKRARGRIRLEATNEGSQTRISVSDDGRGIDPNQILEAATRLNVATTNPPLDIESSLRLIFRAGFTTLRSATDLSGRGVGLDVVETAVEQVGGGLRVSTEPSKGSTFEIVLPVSFGLLGVTVVNSAGNSYCFPSMYVLNGESIGESSYKGSLREMLDQPPTVDAETGEVIRCSIPGRDAFELVVDEIVGSEEVLVRNLGRYAGRWKGVAGAAELRDGSVALVLDLPRLITAAH